LVFENLLAGFNAIFEFFGMHVSTMLLIGGFFAGFYFIYRFFKGKPEEGEKTPTLLRLMTYLGVIVGVMLLGGGIDAWYYKDTFGYHTFTCILAVIVGIALILRPIRSVPWAAIAGIIVGSIVVFFTASYLQFIVAIPADLFGIDPYWILIILFVIILLLVYLAFKMIEDIGKILGYLLSARPTSLAIMILCAIEAILAFMGTSLISAIVSLF
jgi:hypothetical protein